MDKEDVSEIMQKITNMMNHPEQESNATHSDTSPSEEQANPFQTLLSNVNFHGNEKQENNDFQFDLESMLKIKSILDLFQSGKNSPDANLLAALKPYLNNTRKKKLDQYIQFLNISKVLEMWNNSDGGGKQ